MPTYNYKARELIAKIVYYGPGRCGKTTNLQQIHAKMRPETRSELLSVATETDRTIYFDLLPLNLGTISGMRFMVRLFTVPGQVYYGETRKLVLRGADGIVFVADSQDHMMDENRQSLQDLKENLAANALDYSTLPLVFQYNKRDLPRLIPEAELDATLNERGVKSLGAVAAEGGGVLETLRYITVAVFNHIKSGAAKVQTSGPGGPSPTPSSPQNRPRTNTPAAPPAASSGVMAVAGAGPAPAAARPQPAPTPPPSAAHPAAHAAPAAAERKPNGPATPRAPPPPATVGADFYIEEFKHLAIAHAAMAERLSAVENELRRLGRENQEIRELLARR